MGYDPTGHWDWGTFFSGVGLLSTGISALAISITILACPAAAPIMVAVAATTAIAGGLTAVNGIAEIIEAGTDYNVIRDGLMDGNTQAYELYRDITSTVAEIGTIICGSYYAAKGGNVCFVAGTMILTAAGHITIEAVEAGDWVWATDPETGETELKQVVQTFINEATELVHITVNGEEIVCTTEHPFYSPVKGWTAACKLRAGDILVMLNGEYVVVEQVQHELLEAPVTVYNFEVEGFHTYYVGDTGVLVHNMCKPKNIYNSIKEAPGYNKNFVKAQNGLKKVNVKRKELLNELNQIGSGWKKVYHNGWIDGQKVSLHYFQDKTGKIFDFWIKYGDWS